MKQNLLILTLFIILGLIGLNFYFYKFRERNLEVKYLVEKCEVGFPYKNKPYDFIFYENNRTLVVYVWVNCCGVNVTVKREGNTYKIIEKQYGTLCKCMCKRKVIIFDVNKNYKIEFINSLGKNITITPIIGFCGISTYGKCNSDSDCIISGCSNQVCQSRYEKPIITTCEYRECYNAKKYGLKCKCINNRCQWSR